MIRTRGRYMAVVRGKEVSCGRLCLVAIYIGESELGLQVRDEI